MIFRVEQGWKLPERGIAKVTSQGNWCEVRLDTPHRSHLGPVNLRESWTPNFGSEKKGINPFKKEKISTAEGSGTPSIDKKLNLPLTVRRHKDFHTCELQGGSRSHRAEGQ